MLCYRIILLGEDAADNRRHIRYEPHPPRSFLPLRYMSERHELQIRVFADFRLCVPVLYQQPRRVLYPFCNADVLQPFFPFCCLDAILVACASILFCVIEENEPIKAGSKLWVKKG